MASSELTDLRPLSRLRVLLLPPIAWLPYRAEHVPGSGPDPRLLERLMAQAGIVLRILDPNPAPWNPFAGRHPLLRGLDPLRALGVLLRHRDCDVVVSVFEGAAVPLLLLRSLMRLRAPVVLWDIGLTEGWRLRERIQDFVVPRADGLMVLGRNQLDYVTRRWPRRRGPVDMAGHLVDTHFYQPSEVVGLDDEDQPPAPAGYILSVGDDAGRDYPTLLAALAGLPQRSILRTRLALARDPVAHAAVTAMPDRISYRRLRALYQGAAFVVIPLAETLNASGVSAILEAGAMGRAVIVSASSGIADYARPDETCLQVPAHDPAALRAAIQRLSAEPETCARLGANARRFVTETHSTEAFATRFATLLRGYAEQGRVPA